MPTTQFLRLKIIKHPSFCCSYPERFDWTLANIYTRKIARDIIKMIDGSNNEDEISGLKSALIAVAVHSEIRKYL